MIPNVQSKEKNSQIGHYQNYELMLLKNTIRMKRHLLKVLWNSIYSKDVKDTKKEKYGSASPKSLIS